MARYRRYRSRKALLNVTSRKKRNTMITASNTDPSGNVTGVAIKPLNINGTQTGYVVWCPTAMNLARDGGLNTINDESARTATSCYMRGLKETLRIQTSSGCPWFHRRIIFRTTDKQIAITATFNDGSGDTPSTNGMVRLMRNFAISGNPALQQYVTDLNDEVFRGKEGIDWADTLTAATSPNQIDVVSDVHRIYQSGNQYGTVRINKKWIPMNKTLVYDDDERGETKDSNYVSAEGRQGMGNMIILDIIKPGAGAVVGDQIRLDATASLYWHER